MLTLAVKWTVVLIVILAILIVARSAAKEFEQRLVFASVVATIEILTNHDEEIAELREAHKAIDGFYEHHNEHKTEPDPEVLNAMSRRRSKARIALFELVNDHIKNK